MPTASANRLPDFPLQRSPKCPFEVSPELRRLQSDAPVTRARMWDGQEVWLVTGFREGRAVLASPKFTSRHDLPGMKYPYQNSGMAGLHQSFESYIHMDNPEHNYYRGLMTAEFSRSGVENLRPSLEKTIHGQIDKLLDSESKQVDLLWDFAFPTTSLVICTLLGVPYEDHEFFQERSVVAISPESTVEEAAAAGTDILEYLLRLVERRETEPGDGIIGRLAQELVVPGTMTRRALADIGRLQLIAGHESTGNMIALGMFVLLQHPDQADQLRQSDDRALMLNAIDELIRYLSIAHGGRSRIAMEDVELGGQLIRTGDGVVVASDAQNYDPSVFRDPATFDIHRPEAKQHVGFGFGIHRCHGELLARAELEIVYTGLLRRIPTLRLAVDPSEVEYKYVSTNYGVRALPVTW